jgi:hypothetical protein
MNCEMVSQFHQRSLALLGDRIRKSSVGEFNFCRRWKLGGGCVSGDCGSVFASGDERRGTAELKNRYARPAAPGMGDFLNFRAFPFYM